MHTVRSGPVVGLLAQLVLLAALAVTLGLGGAGWLAGLACGVVTSALLARGLRGVPGHRLSPANRVTLTRATLVGGVAALVADAFSAPGRVPTLVALSAVALVLDGVDGWVARHTGSASALGARFDMEVDAFLILVLSVYVCRAHPADWWVLSIGAARYAYVAAGWLLPWLRGGLPARYWRKVVAAVQGIVLTVVAAGVLPWLATQVVLALALALLTESFGHDVRWQWRHRPVAPARLVVLTGRSERAPLRDAVH